MKFKKIFAALLALLLVIVLAGCTASNKSTAKDETSAQSEASKSDESTSAKSSGNSGKTLVVYFSGSGNTKAVAEKIASDTGADTFEITPKDPYTSDDLNYNDENSRVVKEYQNESLQDKVELTATTVPDWDSYTTVFFGYPIWWGDAAWPVRGFIRANDFTGKTVYPFCTSFSSGIGSSDKNLADMAGTGDWQDGQRFEESPSDDDVSDWVDSLNLK